MSAGKIQHYIDYMRGLSDLDLLDLLADALPGKEPFLKQSGMKTSERRFVVALSEMYSNLESEGELESDPCHLTTFAKLDPEAYPHGMGNELLSQSGTCVQCGLEVLSNVKRGICPFCGAKVGMT